MVLEYYFQTWSNFTYAKIELTLKHVFFPIKVVIITSTKNQNKKYKGSMGNKKFDSRRPTSRLKNNML